MLRHKAAGPGPAQRHRIAAEQPSQSRRARKRRRRRPVIGPVRTRQTTHRQRRRRDRTNRPHRRRRQNIVAEHRAAGRREVATRQGRRDRLARPDILRVINTRRLRDRRTLTTNKARDAVIAAHQRRTRRRIILLRRRANQRSRQRSCGDIGGEARRLGNDIIAVVSPAERIARGGDRLGSPGVLVGERPGAGRQRHRVSDDHASRHRAARQRRRHRPVIDLVASGNACNRQRCHSDRPNRVPIANGIIGRQTRNKRRYYWCQCRRGQNVLAIVGLGQNAQRISAHQCSQGKCRRARRGCRAVIDPGPGHCSDCERTRRDGQIGVGECE